LFVIREPFVYFFLIQRMKRIVAKSMLRDYWEKHADSKQYLKTWYDTAKSAKWLSPNDVKQAYINASILKDSRVVFTIKGNSHPLIVSSITKSNGHLFALLARMRNMTK